MGDKTLVSFPGLGLDFNISREAFHVKLGALDFSIYWYGIIIALAFLVCVLWAMKDSRKYDLVPDTVIDLILFAAPAGIIGARIYFVAFSWEDYKNDLIQILNLRNGGLAILGGVIAAVITAYFVAKYKKIPAFKLFDFGIPYIALGQAIGRWGNFFNQEAFGTNTSLPWGMTSSTIRSYLQRLQNSGMDINPDLPVHPTFLYESIWDIGVFIFLMWMRRRKKFDGEVFCFYFITYSLGRAVIEGLRTDSLMLGNVRITQLLSIIFVIVFTIIVIYVRAKIKNDTDEVEIGQSRYADILKMMEEDQVELGESSSETKFVSVGDVEVEDGNREYRDSSQKSAESSLKAENNSQQSEVNGLESGNSNQNSEEGYLKSDGNSQKSVDNGQEKGIIQGMEDSKQ
mgnify:CR=1 FL=1